MKFKAGISAILATAAVALVGATTAALSAIELPPGPNRDLVYGQCRTCHDLQYLVESAGMPRNAWDDLLTSMRQYGLRIPDDQRSKILDYLGTYLGPNPPAPEKGAETTSSADGGALFKEQCVGCHQVTGKGDGKHFPPLAGNSDLFLAPDFPVKVLLHGMEGKIEVSGKKFNSVMPTFDHLSDAQVAAIIHYVRNSWGNADLKPKDFQEIGPEVVAKARQQDMTPQEVWHYRGSLE